VLDILNIDVFYGDVQVIWGVSFSVKKGEVVALIGANGAGKSTILKTVSGLVCPRKGEIHFDGSPIHTVEPFRLVEAGIVHVPEARRLFVEMTVEENLDMGSLKGEAKKGREQSKEMVYGLFPRLRERRRQAAGTLSGGEQQMLAIARGLMSRPRCLMIDEPFLGLAPMVVTRILEIIRRVNAEGVTVLFIEQNVQLALSVSHRAYVLESGRMVLSGGAREVLESDLIRKVYLGI